jgi:hypothetical protein
MNEKSMNQKSMNEKSIYKKSVNKYIMKIFGDLKLMKKMYEEMVELF